MPLRRSLLGLSAAVSGRLLRGLSTAAARPPWAMIYHAVLDKTPGTRASFKLREPPCPSHVFVPDQLVDPGPRPDPDGEIMPLLGGGVSCTSGDGLLLFHFQDGRATAPIVGKHGKGWARQVIGLDMDPDTTRFVCNPISGELFRLPDIDGTKKTCFIKPLGLLTHSDRLDGPPDRYAVAQLVDDEEGMEGSFLMRRFLSQAGEWEKLVGFQSPLPLPGRRHKDYGHGVLAFAGRLWWVDESWGAITADPFSDRPELRFVGLPRGSVTETVPELAKGLPMIGRYRRMGVSDGRMRYVEVSQKEPFVLSSFALEDDGCCWTLEHRVALSRILTDRCYPWQEEEDTPRIGVIDPLNASIMYLTIGNHVISIDMDKRWCSDPRF
ncbi:hypothetical protein PR202_ga05404 [Eleusine coracana subsp. coracana]|uniref:DUF1618 domain-containing protein n=1 Tax=Eleusine coracana subsp. coracana TaxID=191504 RepID=A0AAV5BSS3_ELECO|nr:hypothetical protein PR202_ga04951 [Eleusine coracana subsp. coracana]GJM89235.1 hypothetical protein PR202_ga05404 [Eleusine coracana subsp. coracana]